MEITLCIANGHISASITWSAELAIGHLHIGPEYLSAGGAQSLDLVIILSDIELIHAITRLLNAGQILVPNAAPGSPGDSCGTTVIAGHIDHVALNNR